MGFLEKIFGTYSEREVKKLQLIADKIEALDDSMQSLSDEQLQAKTIEFKDRINNNETKVEKIHKNVDYNTNKKFDPEKREE